MTFSNDTTALLASKALPQGLRWRLGLAAAGILCAVAAAPTPGHAASLGKNVVNQPPTATVSLQAPGGPGNTASSWRPNGQVTAQVQSSDPNGGHVKLTIVWRVNGDVDQTTTYNDHGDDHYDITGLDGGDVVTVTVTPNDGTVNGSSVTATGTIVNHAPVASVSIGGQLSARGGQAVATVTASDADNDPITFTYVWSVNGALMKIDANQKATTDKFDLGNGFSPGDKVAVKVVPNDGYINGSVASDKATINNSSVAPAPPAPPAPKPGPAGPAGPAGPPAPPAGPAAITAATTTTPTAVTTTSAYNPATDPYSMASTTLFSGAQAWWNAGYTGKGIDVAVIDTGVSPVEGLSGSGKIVNGPDLSLDSQNPALRYLDSNGHGTFMAGLIAGHDSTLTAPYANAAASVYRGMAPDARIVNVKVGAADGEVDVTQVIAAIDWVVQHAHDNGLNIRVISLSYGTNSTQSYLVDPLAYAAEQAWKAGIVVVSAAGNTGYQVGSGAPGVADPGYDPSLISVGGYDTMGTSDPGDDRLGDYSASAACGGGPVPTGPGGAPAPKCKGPDLLEIGSHVQGLRVPGSYIDVNNPDGELGTRYFRGSGTSEATALTAGAVALVLQRYPSMTPDQVKAYLQNGGRQIGGIDPGSQGSGEIDLAHLLTGPAAPPAKPQGFAAATGIGSIEKSRGSDHLTLGSSVLTGDEDIFGDPIDTSSLATAEAAGSSWSGGNWNGSTWSGSSWSGSTWSGSTWSGSTWSGSTWSGSTWSGSTWSGSTWSGSSWSGSTWSGSTWSGSSWSSDSWS